MKKAAIFDMDGLMFDSENVFQKNWRAIADEMGVTLPVDWVSQICGTSGAHMNHVIERNYHVEDGAPIQAEVYRRVENDLAVDCPEKPGLHEILEYLYDQGVVMAVASSNYTHIIERNLKNTNTDPFFKTVVSGKDVKHGKPAPDIFLYAAEKIGFDPKDCYVFEDGFNGIEAAYAAGCAPIMIPDQFQPTDEIRAMCVGVYDTLLDAKKAFEDGEL